MNREPPGATIPAIGWSSAATNATLRRKVSSIGLPFLFRHCYHHCIEVICL